MRAPRTLGVCNQGARVSSKLENIAQSPPPAAAAPAAAAACRVTLASPAFSFPIQADADALAECPNYWVPRDVVEGRAPVVAAAEQAVQQLYRRLVKARLAPHDGCWEGAEFWCQVGAVSDGNARRWHAVPVRHRELAHRCRGAPLSSS